MPLSGLRWDCCDFWRLVKAGKNRSSPTTPPYKPHSLPSDLQRDIRMWLRRKLRRETVGYGAAVTCED